MQKLLFILFIISFQVTAQDINGIYSTHYTSFVNPSNDSKNFDTDSNDLVTIDFNDSENSVKGYFSITSKSRRGESVNLKFKLLGDKKVDYENGYTKILFNTHLIVLNEEVPDIIYQVLLSIKSDDIFLTVFYPEDTYQSWMLAEKL